MSMTFNSDYDSEIVAIFLEEIDGYLPELEISLGKLNANAKDKDALEVAHRLAHTIKGTAASLGFNEVSKQGQALEQVLTPVFEKKAQLTPQSLQECDGHLVVLKQMLAQMHASVNGEAVAQPQAQSVEAVPLVAAPPEPLVAPVSDFNLFDDLPPFTFNNNAATPEPAATSFNPLFSQHSEPANQHQADFLDDFFSTALPDLPQVAEESPVFSPEAASPFDDFFAKVESPAPVSEDVPDWLAHNKPATTEDVPDWLKEPSGPAPKVNGLGWLNDSAAASEPEEKLPNWFEATPSADTPAFSWLEPTTPNPENSESLPTWLEQDVPSANALLNTSAADASLNFLNDLFDVPPPVVASHSNIDEQPLVTSWNEITELPVELPVISPVELFAEPALEPESEFAVEPVAQTTMDAAKAVIPAQIEPTSEQSLPTEPSHSWADDALELFSFDSEDSLNFLSASAAPIQEEPTRRVGDVPTADLPPWLLENNPLFVEQSESQPEFALPSEPAFLATELENKATPPVPNTFASSLEEVQPSLYSPFEIDAHHAPADVTAEGNLDLPPLDDLFDFEQFPFSPPAVNAPFAASETSAEVGWEGLDDIFSTSEVDLQIDRLQQQILPEIPSDAVQFEAVPLPSEIAISDTDLLAQLAPPASVNIDFPAVTQDTGRADVRFKDNALPDLAEVEALLDILEPVPTPEAASFDWAEQLLAESAVPPAAQLENWFDLPNLDDLVLEPVSLEENPEITASALTEIDAATPVISMEEFSATLQPLETEVTASEPATDLSVVAETAATLPDAAELAEAGLEPTIRGEDNAAISAALSNVANLPAGLESLTEEELAMAMESGFDFSDFAEDGSGFGFDAAPMWLAEAQADIDNLYDILEGAAPLQAATQIRDIAATLRKGAELMELTEITNQLSVIETMVGMVISADLPNSPNTLVMLKNAYADFVKLVEPYQEAARAILNPEPAVPSEPLLTTVDSFVATPPPPPVVPLFNVAQPPMGVEVDRELAETFAEEAEEHIQNLDTRLAALEKDPANRELIREIRRTAHTLKGSAAMVGFHVVSHTAHLMEDLLDRLFDGSMEVSEPLIELLFVTFNAIDTMVRSLRTGCTEDVTLLEALRPRYEAVLEADSQAAEESGGAIIFERKGTAALSADSISPEAASEMLTEAAFADANVSAAFDTELAVRVPIGRLDGMMNQVGELVINRTVLEQRNQVFDRAVEELKLSINRLQRISRELETRYEVELLKNGSLMNTGVAVGAGNGNSRNRAGESYLSYPATPEAIGSEFDTLEMDRYTEFHTLSREMSETVSDIAAVQRELDNLRDDFDNVSVQQSRLTDDLQDRLVKVRLVPLSNLTPRLYRTVRTVAAQQAKEIEFVVSGDSTQVDKTIFEEIADPLLHLVRNAVDHGIESSQERLVEGKKNPATVGFAARSEGSEVVIEVTDDGRGIDLQELKQRGIERGFMSADAKPTDEEIYNLMFLPGFSTSQTISEISGRGVGLDVVKANVTRLKGVIEVASQPGKGTTFSIRIPNTLAISRAMLVQAGGYTYAIPLNVVEETARLEPQAVIPGSEKYGRGSYYRYNGETLPLYELSGLLHLPAHARKLAELQADDDELNNSRRERPLLIITGAQRYALLIDNLAGQQEVVVKPLGSHLKAARGVVGATILGNGQVILILNVYELVTMDRNQRQLVGGTIGSVRTGQMTDLGAARPLSEAELRERELSALRSRDFEATTGQVAAKVRRTPVIQVVDDSLSIRKVLSGALEKAGFRVRTSKDGQEALETIQQNAPDLIIMDIEMPRMDGYQLTSILKNDPGYQPIPIVMLTSRAGLKHRQKAEEVGADGFLVKPYKEEELLGIVSELLIRAGG